MADKKMEFLKAPAENLQTWNIIRKIMVYSAAGVLILLLIMYGVLT